jgi:hypothetical protein
MASAVTRGLPGTTRSTKGAVQLQRIEGVVDEGQIGGRAALERLK